MNERRDLVDLAKERTETRHGGDWMDSFLGPMTTVRQEPPNPDEWVLVFNWTTNPLPMNGSRGSHRAHARDVRFVRTIAARESKWAGIPHLEHAELELVQYVRDSRRRDVDNLVQLLKAIKDGLVDHGVTIDDTPEYMHTLMPRIVRVDRIRNATAWFELTVRRWDPDGGGQ